MENNKELKYELEMIDGEKHYFDSKHIYDKFIKKYNTDSYFMIVSDKRWISVKQMKSGINPSDNDTEYISDHDLLVADHELLVADHKILIELVKRQDSDHELLVTFIKYVTDFITEQREFNAKQLEFNESIIKRLDNIVAKNNLIE